MMIFGLLHVYVCLYSLLLSSVNQRSSARTRKGYQNFEIIQEIEKYRT